MTPDNPPHVSYPLTYHGVVVDNADPDGAHRVRVSIPGIVELTGWAYPITSGGGSAQRGGHIVPAEGSEVVVWFIGGWIERPIYACGWWPPAAAEGPRMPTDVVAAGAQAHQVQSIEIGDFKLTFDERDDKRTIRAEHITSGDFIEWDLKNQGLQISMSAAILLKCSGLIDIDAAQVSIIGRQVLADSKGI